MKKAPWDQKDLNMPKNSQETTHKTNIRDENMESFATIVNE